MQSTIGGKGRVTLPIEIRCRLGVTPGDRVEFVMDGNRIVIRSASELHNPLDKHIKEHSRD